MLGGSGYVENVAKEIIIRHNRMDISVYTPYRGFQRLGVHTVRRTVYAVHCTVMEGSH